MEASTDLFINIIQNHRIIYDTTSKDFKNIHKKEDEWVKIANESRMSVDAAKKRYFSLRQKFSREKKKETTCSRNKETFRPSVFFHRLTFLDDFIKPRRTFTNDVDGIDSSIYEDENSGGPSVRRRRMNDLSDEEYAYQLVYGESYSLAEEEAMDQEAFAQMREEGLLPDENQISHNDYEVAVEQPENPAVDGDRSDTNSPNVALDHANETQRLRAILSPDEQELHHGSTSNGFYRENIMSTGNGEKSLQTPEQQLYQRSTINLSSPMNNFGSERALQPSSNATYSTDPQNIPIQRHYIDTQPNHYGTEVGQNNERCMPARMSSVLREHSSNVGSVSTAIRGNGSKQAQDHTPRKVPTSTVTSSALSKNSPLVQAAVATRQQDKSSAQSEKQSSAKGANNMEAIREKMESYLKACTDKVQKKPERSPHATFLSYLGTKMEKVPLEKIESLEKAILDLVFRASHE